VTGADQHMLTVNRKERNNGCGTGIKRGCAVMEIRLMDSHKLLQSAVKVCVNPSRLKRKKFIFFQGEVFFLLTRPLMGDPHPKNYNVEFF
jgi:hypothetical protein